MASKLYELIDGREVVDQKADKQNRLIYVLKDGSETLAEKVILKEFTIKPQKAKKVTVTLTE